MKKLLRNLAIFIVVFASAYFIAKLGKNTYEPIEREQILLGTVVSIQVKNVEEKEALQIISGAFDEIRRIDNLFTTYDDSSPVMKINNSKDSIFTNIDKEILSILNLCDSISEMTENSFDVSIHELINTWGFESDTPSVPDKKELLSALASSGWDNIKINNDKIIRRAGVKFNFGAVAKGYAVEKGIEYLRNHGIRTALINAGGEVKTLGKGWIVGVRNPDEGKDFIVRLKLDDFSAATSGDYEKYFEEEGIRYHHILDPKTGNTARKCRSVTILNKNNAAADALATGIFVLGPEKGMKLVELLPGTEALIIDSAGKIYYSSGFNKYVVQ